MKKTNCLLLIATIIFLILLLLIVLNTSDFIDVYSKNIPSFFTYPHVSSFFLVVTNIMSFTGIMIIFLLTIFLLRKKSAKRDIFIYLIAITLGVSLNAIIKILVGRSRPISSYLEVTGYSFPSGHSLASMIVYGYLVLLIKKYYQGKREKLYITFLLLAIFLTGFSRIYFNVHYITDVLAGYSLGIIILCISNYFLNHNIIK